MSGHDAFRAFAAERGFELPVNIEPGRRFRFSTNGKRRDDAGWGILFRDGLGGVIGDWRTGQTETWQAKRDRQLSQAEFKEWREQIERERKEAEQERAREAEEAGKLATNIWESSSPAPERHSYLHCKKVPAYGLRIYSGPKLIIRGMECTGALIMPLRNSEGAIRSLEFIAANGEKRFLPGGDYRGCYYAVGKPADTIAIAEGFATGATVHRETGYPVRISATAGNLLEVAKAIRAKAPKARLIPCADNDQQTVCQKHKAEGVTSAVDPLSPRPEWCRCNPGVTAALEAARAVDGLLAIPSPKSGTDFNDLRSEGGDVKAQVDAARAVATTPASPNVNAPALERSTPEPLPELPSVPPFNLDVLPGVLRAFVRDIAERMQCPPEFPAVGAVVMAGSAIGRRLGIRPKKYDSWTVVPNLWGMIVGKSGIMKSPALADAIAPLKRMQAKAFEQYELEKAEYDIAARAEKIRSSHAEAEARKALSKDRGANLNAMLRPDAELEEPKARRYVVNDSTPEALCETLKDNPYGVLCERDELIGLLRSMDKEGQQEARALYLTAADGDKSFTVDRIMRGSGRYIEGVCVSIVGGIQPGVLAGYVRETQRSGAGDDGLLQRFGLMVYPDIGREWRNVDRPENTEAKKAVHALIERLCGLTPEQAGAEPGPEGGIPFLRFNDAAQALFVEWLADLEAKIRSGEDHPAIVSHLSKYRKVVPALALINHLCEGIGGPVTEAALARALLFIELLEGHARRVYSYAARPDLDAAKTVLAKLRAGKLPLEFSARHVYRAGWSGLTTPEETGSALRLLEDYGYIEERRNNETGGRASTIYFAHPSCGAAA